LRAELIPLLLAAADPITAVRACELPRYLAAS